VHGVQFTSAELHRAPDKMLKNLFIDIWN